MLDQELNNTSVILLQKLLFSGDAANRELAIRTGPEKYQSLLAGVNPYKVGHHGSSNATPKPLLKLFKNKSSTPHTGSADGLLSSAMRWRRH